MSKNKPTGKAKELDDKIEDIELADMGKTEIEKVVSALSEEGMLLRRTRRDVRYQLYRLRTDAEGKCATESTKEFAETFEKQDFFDGWRNFATTWDVAYDDPYRIVHRMHSEQEEWDELVRAKFPNIQPGGKIVYPDITVRNKVQAEVDKRKKKKTK